MDIMSDQASSRVMNGRHSEGALVPLLVTSTPINIANHKLFALMFEPFPQNMAIGKQRVCLDPSADGT